MKIKTWYTKQFKTDELGHEIAENATFEGLFEALDNYKDVYKYIGVADSLVRERVFQKLAEIMQVEYSYIYEQWLRA